MSLEVCQSRTSTKLEGCNHLMHSDDYLSESPISCDVALRFHHCEGGSDATVLDIYICIYCLFHQMSLWIGTDNTFRHKNSAYLKKALPH